MSLDFSKHNEDWLYRRQEQLEIESKTSSDEYKNIEAELNRRADLHNLKQQFEKSKVEAKKKQIEEAIAEYEAVIAEHGEGVTMKAMTLEFGDVIKEDYYIDDQYTVISLAGSTNENNNTAWYFECIEDARAKIEQLVYWRVYNKHFRDGADSETLLRLKMKIVELKLEY